MNPGGQRAAEAPMLDYDNRHLLSVECEAKNANCTDESGYGPWGQNPLIRDQMDLAYGSHTCLEISDTSPTQTDLLNYDIIVVEGGDYFWNTTLEWLDGPRESSNSWHFHFCQCSS